MKIRCLSVLLNHHKSNSGGFINMKVFVLSLLAFPLSLKAATQAAKSKTPVTLSPVLGSITAVQNDFNGTSDSTKVLKGIVLDGDTPIVGATVMIKGKYLQTVTDKEGKFELDLSSLESGSRQILRVIYIGYDFKEEKLNLKELKPLRILMTDAQCLMGEVVITRRPGLIKRIIKGL